MQTKAKFYYFFILIVALFGIPLFIATYLYHHPNLLANKMTNKGQLILPPIAGNQLNLSTNNKWMLVLFEPESCREICLKKLYYLRQMQIASGKDHDRITRVLLSYNAQSLPVEAGETQIISSDQYHKIMLKNKVNFAAQAGSVFIVDPHGNMILAYRPTTNPMDIFKDLKHLLKLSQIG